MKLTMPSRWSLGLAAALVFLVAGCGNGHPTAASVDYRKSPAMPSSMPLASKNAIRQAVKTECAAVRKVRHSARKLSRKPVTGHLGQLATLGPGWADQLATAADRLQGAFPGRQQGQHAVHEAGPDGRRSRPGEPGLRNQAEREAVPVRAGVHRIPPRPEQDRLLEVNQLRRPRVIYPVGPPRVRRIFAIWGEGQVRLSDAANGRVPCCSNTDAPRRGMSGNRPHSPGAPHHHLPAVRARLKTGLPHLAAHAIPVSRKPPQK